MNDFEREFGRMQSEVLSIFDSLSETEKDKLADYIREYGYGKYDDGYEAGLLDGEGNRYELDYDEGYAAGYAAGLADCE